MPAKEPPEGHPAREPRRRGAPKGSSGQPAYERDEETAEKVKLYAMWGLVNGQIAGVLDMGESCLKKYYQPELTAGRANGVKVAAGKLYEKILSGNIAAIIFYLKAKGGFQERQAHQLVDEEGDPIDLSNFNLADISDELLRAVKQFLAAAIAAGGGGTAGESGSGRGEAGA